MNARGHLPRIVERLLKIERRVRQVYSKLAERDEFPVELREVWSALAADENSHRITLERSIGLLNFVSSLPPISEVKLAKVEEQVATVEAILQQQPLRIDDALGHALQLESSELTDVVEAWEYAFSPRLSELTRSDAPNEKTHVRRLVEAVQTFSANPELHERAAAVWSRHNE